MKAEGARDLRQRRLLGFAYCDTADPQKTALRRCFGNMLADLSKPTLERYCITRRPEINQCTDLP